MEENVTVVQLNRSTFSWSSYCYIYRTKPEVTGIFLRFLVSQILHHKYCITLIKRRAFINFSWRVRRCLYDNVSWESFFKRYLLHVINFLLVEFLDYGWQNQCSNRVYEKSWVKWSSTDIKLIETSVKNSSRGLLAKNKSLWNILKG